MFLQIQKRNWFWIKHWSINEDVREKERCSLRACYFHTKTERSLHANVILHSNTSQTITTAAKLAAAFTSLSPDVWASDVSPRISSLIVFPFQELLEVPNTAERPGPGSVWSQSSDGSMCSQRLDVPEAFNQEMFSISSPRVPLLDLWSSQ